MRPIRSILSGVTLMALLTIGCSADSVETTTTDDDDRVAATADIH